MRFARTLLVVTCSLSIAATAAAQTAPRRSFETLRSREQALTSTTPAPSVTKLRKQVAGWDAFVRRYPVSGYADDALWAAAELSSAISERTQADADRQRAAKYYRWLAREYPTSDKVKAALARASALEQPEKPAVVATRTPAAPRALAGEVSALPRPTATRGVLPPAPAPDASTRVSPSNRPAPDDTAPATLPVVKPAVTNGPRLKDIRRTILPELVRVTIELDDEAAFTHERIDGPARVFFDVKAPAVPALQDRVLSFADDVVRQVRVGRRPAQSTRVVLDLEGVSRYSVFTLYTPFRIVVDLERARGTRAVRPDVTSPTLVEQWADTAPAGSAPAASAAPATTAAPSQSDLVATVPASVDALPAPSSAPM
ncbi:MAG: AMIN domain-containing protein, partial [Acidobacteria bacterium]|nr:AMIN domain-containing protein [Acidobacteriota bacterium]